MLRDRYESDAYIGSVHCPLLILHGEKDEVIPVAMGRKMYGWLKCTKRHCDLQVRRTRRSLPVWVL